MANPDTQLGGKDDEKATVSTEDNATPTTPTIPTAPITMRCPASTIPAPSASPTSADMTPTPVSSYVTLKQAIKPEGETSSKRYHDTEPSPAARIGTMTKLAAGTVLIAATTLTSINVDLKRPKTPRPPHVIMGSGNPGDAGDESGADSGTGGAAPPDPSATAETERCTPDITADGRPVQEGTCVLVFALGEDTVYMARLEKARIMIDNANYEVEVEYGAVRGIAGQKHPSFLVRGSEHFLKADMQLQGTIWVENTENGKVATVKSEEGETLLQTSWSGDMVLEKGEYGTFALEAPEGEAQPVCSVRWNGQSPKNDAEVWLSMLGALAALGVARRAAKRAEGRTPERAAGTNGGNGSEQSRPVKWPLTIKLPRLSKRKKD